MKLNPSQLIYIAVAFAIIGIILFITGPFLPLPPVITFAIVSICFIIVIVAAILAMCTYQSDYAQSRGREVF
ncbi:MAG: hypothetical protein ACFE9D_08010 [Promethearchaeota archaeon]